MSEEKIEPETLPSTSQSMDSQKNGIFPLVSMPKIVLTRLDLQNLPIPLYTSPPLLKKPVKRLTEKKTKILVPKTLPKKTVSNVKHDTRFRGKPKKDYKFLSEMGTSLIETPKSKLLTGKNSNVKKIPKLTAKQEDNTVKGMLKKTMLQKRSKISIPPAKKPKLMPTKPAKNNMLTPKLKKGVSIILPPKKEETVIKPKPITTSSFYNKPMDTDASEDEFLYDELIDELVNSPLPKIQATEKTTNITLKPNVGNKPPTIVKGGIVKKSILPPDLKAVASPTTLNSTKLTGNTPIFKSKTLTEHLIKTPETAEAPKASLPTKASPFPISINSSPPKTGTKNQGKKGHKKSASIKMEDPPLSFDTPKSTNKQSKGSSKPGGKSSTSVPKPKGRPRIGPKKVSETYPLLNTTTEEESDEYTEIETLENIDTESIETLSNLEHDSTKDVKEATPANTGGIMKSNRDQSFGNKSNEDENPNLDLLRILTDDTDDAVQTDLKVHVNESENPHSSPSDNSSPNNIPPVESDPPTLEKSDDSDFGNPGGQEAENSLDSQSHEPSMVQTSEETSVNPDDLSEPTSETVVEEAPPVRTVYDLMSEISLQYPSWNLHIIPETNAFCIAQVTKGRLGLPTLKKCIELDPDTYSAKVYIHQYHIKRFDGVYDSEEAILALFEEIHSIKA